MLELSVLQETSKQMFELSKLQETVLKVSFGCHVVCLFVIVFLQSAETLDRFTVLVQF